MYIWIRLLLMYMCILYFINIMYVLVKSQSSSMLASHLTGNPAKSSKVAKLDEGWGIRRDILAGNQTWQTGKSPN